MLQTIREKAQGWIAWFIVILISIPFALWGINSYLGGGSEPIMASVNGVEITERAFERRYREFREQLRERMGASYRPELLDEKVLRRQVLESMIGDEVIRQASGGLGLAAGDALVREAILSIQAFQVDGRFNQQVYESALRSRGMVPAGFEEQVRQQLISNQLSRAISGSAIATDAEVAEFVRLRQQTREFQFARIPAERFEGEIVLTDAEVRAHYDANQAGYVAPERVKVEYLDLDVANIAQSLTADAAIVEGYYEQTKGQYVAPERRRASHILISVEESAEEEAVKAAEAKAQAALDRVRGGEAFAEVAREVSEDPGSADLGGDLDLFERGIMDPAFEEAVFAMNVGDVSDPVRSAFGFHIIELTDIRPETGKSFEEAREEVEAAYLKSEASRLFYEYAERVSDLVYEDPNSLEPAAHALSLKIRKSDWLTRDGGDGVFEAPKVVSAAFSDDVLVERHNSEAVELAPEHIVVLRVTDHEEQSVKPFEQVEAVIREQMTLARASEKAREQAALMIEALKAGGEFAAVAGERGLELEPIRRITRDERELPGALVSRLFTLSRPTSENPVFGDAGLPNGDVAVIALVGVEDGDAADIATLGGSGLLKSVLSRSTGQTYYQHLTDDMRAMADVLVIKKDTEETP